MQITGDSLILGSFDVIGRRTAELKVTDAFNNTSTKVLTIEVYSPIPQINEVTSTGFVLGTLDEKIPFEPIHLFRVRPDTDITRLNT